MNERPCGVTVLGDLARPGADGRPGGADRQTRALHQALRAPIAEATGRPVRLVTAGPRTEVGRWLMALRSTAEAASWWAHMHDGTVMNPDGPPPGLPSFAAQALHQAVCAEFVVAAELPGWLQRVLDRLGVPWIDLRLHPVRFMDDLLIAARSSEDATQSWLRGRAVEEARARESAIALAKLLHDPPLLRLEDDTLLVQGEPPHSPSRITGGRFIDPDRTRSRVERVCGAYGGVALRGPAEDGLLRLARQLRPDAVNRREGLYRLLAQPEIVAVAGYGALSTMEAGYFGKDVRLLGDAVPGIGWRGEAGRFTSLDAGVLEADFWREVLSPHMAVTAVDGRRTAPRLRDALVGWGPLEALDATEEETLWTRAGEALRQWFMI